jgi:hypothetical protein
MLRKIRSSVALACIGLVACGGAIQEDETTSAGTGAKTTMSAPGVAPSSIAPWGSWDLVWLEGAPGGKRSAHAFGHLYLELRTDGTAIARRCTKPYYEPALLSVRCADSQAYDCVYGTVAWDGTVWRVDLPDLRASAKESRGEIIMSETADDITVRYILPQYAAGRFARVTHDSPTKACAGP